MFQAIHLSGVLSTNDALLLLSVFLMATFFFALLCAESKTEKEDADASAEVEAGNAVDSTAIENRFKSAQSRKKTLSSTKKTVKTAATTRSKKRKQTKSSDKKATASRKSRKPLMKLPPKSVIIFSENSDPVGKSAIKESGVHSTGSFVRFEPRKTEKLDGTLDSVIPAPDEVPHL